MMYEELIKALRCCADDACGICPYSEDDRHCGASKLAYDAAAAIDELQQIAEHYEQTAKDYWKEACEYKAQLPKRGKWIGRRNHKKCSVCDKQAIWDVALQHDMETPYCPNCGARMDGGKQE